RHAGRQRAVRPGTAHATPRSAAVHAIHAASRATIRAGSRGRHVAATAVARTVRRAPGQTAAARYELAASRRQAVTALVQNRLPPPEEAAPRLTLGPPGTARLPGR